MDTKVNRPFPRIVALLLAGTSVLALVLSGAALGVSLWNNGQARADQSQANSDVAVARAEVERARATRDQERAAAQERKRAAELDAAYAAKGYQTWEPGLYWQYFTQEQYQLLGTPGFPACGGSCGAVFVVAHEGCPGGISATAVFLGGLNEEKNSARAATAPPGKPVPLVFASPTSNSTQFALDSMKCEQ